MSSMSTQIRCLRHKIGELEDALGQGLSSFLENEYFDEIDRLEREIKALRKTRRRNAKTLQPAA